MKIINIDKNGNVIKDLSKVKIPEELQKRVIQIYYGNKKKEIKDEQLSARI